MEKVKGYYQVLTPSLLPNFGAVPCSFPTSLLRLGISAETG